MSKLVRTITDVDEIPFMIVYMDSIHHQLHRREFSDCIDAMREADRLIELNVTDRVDICAVLEQKVKVNNDDA